MTRAWNRLRRVFGKGRLIGLLLLVDLLVVRAWDPQLLVAMRFKFFDMFQQWLPRQEAAFPVTIVDIDEASLARLGQWPWPRSVLASLVNRLQQDGAAAIGFDVAFAEPDRNLSIDTTRLLQLPPSDLKAALTNLETNDAIFANAIKRGRVVLGEIALTADERPPAPPRDAPVTPGLKNGDPRPYLNHFGSLVENIPELAAAAAGRGNFSLIGDVDGIVRRVPLVVGVGDTIVPSLDVEVLRVATGQKGYSIQLEKKVAGTTSGIAFITVAGIAIETDHSAFLYVRFGPHDRRRFVSAEAAIGGRVDPARFKGHLVLVGTSAAGLRDLRVTPLSASMPGVEIHAQLLENVLAGQYLVRPSYALGLELVVIALGGLLLIGFVPEVSARWTLGLHGAASAGLFGGSLYLFAERAVLLDWSFPVFAGSTIYLLLIYLKYARTEKQRKLVAAQFSQYLSPVLVQQLQREPERLRLGGEIKTITMMFCDVRDFTSISERLRDDPQALTSLVNRFLDTMTEAVLAEGGTIDKYVGDSLIAFWNAPVDLADHAARACRAALAMTKALQRLNEEQKVQAAAGSAGAAALPLLLAMGVGINTGECLVGNLGSSHRFNYSALGDAVNLSSRIESLSKHYGVPIIISESTRKLVPEFAALELDAVAVVGKTEAVKIYGILGPPEEARSDAFRHLTEVHNDILAAYRRSRWEEAKSMLDDCVKLDRRLAKLHRRYRRRIAHFEQHPPGAGWDGVYRAETK
ncbi:MAG TPA: adenylate/guanylate cyclase domain-containing protein [Candidatus Angelobacter sp.]|nr:adenylate/guanylate cyclase domain-containing protein [Candidatus Angelobacter sp.]